MNCCNHDCHQGRDCPLRAGVPEEFADSPLFTFDEIRDLVFGLFAAVGVIATAGGIAFLAGFYL